MCVVHLLLHLLPRDVQVVTPDGDNIVATVCGRVVDRLMLPHKRDRNLTGEAAEWALRRADVDEVPRAIVC